MTGKPLLFLTGEVGGTLGKEGDMAQPFRHTFISVRRDKILGDMYSIIWYGGNNERLLGDYKFFSREYALRKARRISATFKEPVLIIVKD